MVVDNASHDQTAELVRRHKSVRVIVNPANFGFARAVNQGIALLDTDLVFVLNPDVELTSSIQELESACLLPETGIAAGLLTDDAGRPQRGFALRRFPTPSTLVLEVLGINRLWPFNPINRAYRCFDADLSRPILAEQPPGAFLMFRREVWHRLGGFDTQFDPLWFEDVDFCKRAADLGLKIRYVPSVTAIHQGGHSIAGLPWQCRNVYWYVSLLKYASKHFRPRSFRIVSGAVVLGSFFRAAIGVITQRNFRPFGVYAKIGRFAIRGLISGRVGEMKQGLSVEAVKEETAVKN